MHILEIGPPPRGPTFAGCATLDSLQRMYITHVAVWGEDKLPFEDNLFDYVYASHVLEHVPWFQTRYAMSEAYRILKPGGKLEIWVPDFEILVKVYLAGEFPKEDWNPENEENELMKWVCGRLFYGLIKREDSCWHRAAFDERYLKKCFIETGFKDVVKLDKPPKEQTINHDFINLGVSGIK